MNMENNKNKQDMFLNILTITIVVLIIWFFRNSLRDVMVPFLYALILAYLFDPVVKLIEEQGIKRIQAVVIVFLVMIIIIVGLLMIFIPQLTEEITSFVNNLPGLLNDFENYLNELPGEEIRIIPESFLDILDIDLEESIGEGLDRITSILRSSFNQLYSILVTSTGTILNLFLSLFIAFYYLKDKRLFFITFLKRIPVYHRPRIRKMIFDIDKAIGGYIKGQLLVTLFVGFLTGLGSAIIGIPYSLIIGLVAGVTNIIPYFGPFIGGVLPVAIALGNEPITALYILIWIIIVQQVESNFVRPVLLSHNIGLHPLVVIFSILFFGRIFGVIGMIIGVPLTAILIIIVQYFLELKSTYQLR